MCHELYAQMRDKAKEVRKILGVTASANAAECAMFALSDEDADDDPADTHPLMKSATQVRKGLRGTYLVVYDELRVAQVWVYVCLCVCGFVCTCAHVCVGRARCKCAGACGGVILSRAMSCVSRWCICVCACVGVYVSVCVCVCVCVCVKRAMQVRKGLLGSHLVW